jgi:single-strand DNA-binding protein
MYQQITIIGNVGQDPEMRYTASGAGVCSFSVAVNKTWTDRNTNEKREKTTWFRISAWRQLGETCSTYVRKGMMVMVTGEVESNAYTSRDGQARASLDVTARDVRFLSRSDEGGGGRSYSDSGSGSSDYQQEYTEDDIPF